MAGEGAGDYIPRSPIYLDYNATTPVHPDVVDAMNHALKTLWRNPSSSYALNVRDAIAKSRRQVADFIDAEPDEILFTSSGTEADNWILLSAVNYLNEAGNHGKREHPACTESRTCLVISNIEHDAVRLMAVGLEKRGLCDLVSIPVRNNGVLDVRDVMDACSGTRPYLLSVMLANNETGMLQPIAEIAKELSALNNLRESQGLHPVLFHTDAAQALGKVPVDVRHLGVDFLTIVGHKFYGPRSGAVYCRKRLLNIMKPMFFGGGQERGFRPGTENVVDIVGLGKAAEISRVCLHSWNLKYRKLGELFRQLIQKTFGPKCKFNFPVCSDFTSDTLPNTFSLSFPEIQPPIFGNEILSGVSVVQASTGAACHSGSCQVSSILLSSHLKYEEAASTVRISFGKDTTEDDLREAVADLSQALTKLESRIGGHSDEKLGQNQRVNQ